MVAEDRAGHVGHERDVLGSVGRRSEYGPGVPGVALLLEPGVEVVAYHGEVEPRPLGLDEVPDQVLRWALFAHHRVAYLGQICSSCRVTDPPSIPAGAGRDAQEEPRRALVARSVL